MLPLKIAQIKVSQALMSS